MRRILARMGEPVSDFDALKSGLLQRVAELEKGAAEAEARWSLEARVWDLEEQAEDLRKSVGLAFLLISAVCWAIILSKHDG